MPNDNTHNRDIALHYKNSTLVRISELHRGYDPLQYPLIFPHGTDGWQLFEASKWQKANLQVILLLY